MKDQRPKNLNLLTIYFPIPAIISILHRVSGVILFIFIPLLLWALQASLSSQQDFDQIQSFFTLGWVKFLIWCLLSAFIYHFIAGVRHLLMDIHIGDELKSGRLSAILTAILSGLFIILLGVWLW